jgi:hypothetical protein
VGSKELEQFLVGIAETFNLVPFEPTESIVQRDKVVVIMFERSTNRATGRSVDKEYVRVYTLKDGKVAMVRIIRGRSSDPSHHARTQRLASRSRGIVAMDIRAGNRWRGLDSRAIVRIRALDSAKSWIELAQLEDRQKRINGNSD